VIPHSDGAGPVDRVGEGVPDTWLGQRVWCHGAQTYRPFGTAAEYAVVPLARVQPLPEPVPLAVGATLGIPGITAHRAVHVAGPVQNRTVLIQGGAGAVGSWAVHLAHRAGALVIATVRSAADQSAARRAGADHVLIAAGDLAHAVRRIAPSGVDHIVEVAFGANVATDVDVLAVGGSIAVYASDVGTPQIPFWPMAFANARVYFLGSDDFPPEAREIAAEEVTRAAAAGWFGPAIAAQLPLADIARAHELVERPISTGRVVIAL
jgi:NADPH2:quinone reductase